MSTVAQRLPADRRFEFSSDACPADTFAVVRMSGVEAISKPYRFELVLVSDDAAIDFAKMVGSGAQLRILAPDDHTRATPYAGMLAEFDQLHQAGGFTFYRAVLVPRLWQLSLYRNSEVYLNEQTIPEIVESLLVGARFSASRDYTLKLSGTYRPHSYVCQYQETPLAFVSRSFEREGIYYYFEQVEGVDRLVLLDDKVAQPAEVLAVNYRPADELDVGLAPDSVQAFVCRSRMLPRTLVLQDYNHRRANLPLEVKAEVSASGLGEEMLYGENFRSEEEGQRYATIRAEELRCGARVFSGEATAVGLRSGHFMELTHHYRADFNGRYLVTEITHEGSQAGALLDGLKTPFNEGERQTTSYRNSFVALPAATQFRPARTTPKPRVSGTMNATIDAEGSGEYAELDAYGQYKVQIPFDRTEKGAAKGSRPMRMASPYAGSDHGMHFPLHKGAEVLLSFVDGDPDRPVILGAVPNSDNRSVVDSTNPQLSMIRTKGGNEIGFDDTRGNEGIWLRSPYQDSALFIGCAASVLGSSAAPAPSGDGAASSPTPVGNIFQATKGGSDTVTFGNANVMNFGSKNLLSLGTEASLVASLANKVTMGASLNINMANEFKWNMNLAPFASVGKNVTIDDSDAVTFKNAVSTTALNSVSLSAGVSRGARADMWSLQTHLKIMRTLAGAFTAANFAQSAVFGMAVNGSAGGALAPAQDVNQHADDQKSSKDPMQETGLMGWPGAVCKFGVDAVVNVNALLSFQLYAKMLAERIQEVKNASCITLNDEGIDQRFDEGGNQDARFRLSGNGIEATSDGFSVQSRGVASIEAKNSMSLSSPSVELGRRGDQGNPALITIDEQNKTVRAETSKSSLELKGDATTLISGTISVGHGLVVPDPRGAILGAEELAAQQLLDAATRVADRLFSTYENASSELAKSSALEAWYTASDTQKAESDKLNSIKLKRAQLPAPTEYLNGLQVDAAATSLTHTSGSLSVASASIDMKLGSTELKLDPVGMSFVANLIRLG